MALMLHGTAAGLYGGVGQLPPRSESHPSSAARACSASGASAKPSPAHQRCAPLGLTWFGPGLAGRATRRVAVAGCSPCPRTIVHSPDRPTWPLRWVGDVDCGVHLVPTFGRPAGPELVRWSSPGRGSLLPR